MRKYSIKVFCALFSLVFACFSVASFADPLDNWHWRNPLPQGHSLFGINYVNDTFVAVGVGGTILTSSDGINWTSRSSGTTNSLKNITYASNIFVAVGVGGTILTSSDGINWTPRSSGTSVSLDCIDYGLDTFVVAGQNGTILASPDGINWTPQSSGTTNSLQDITYASNIFVAVGDSGTILTSPDGITWAPRSSGTTNALYGITYSNGTFVAVGLFGTILTSPNGIIWTSRSSGTTNSLKNITYASNIFVAVGVHGTILTSPDGITWTLRTSGTSVHLSGITYGSNTFIAVGDSGTILASPDGINWTHRSSGTTNRLQDITYASNIFVAVGVGGTILTSSDGINWTPRSSGTSVSLDCIDYGLDTFVVAGQNGTILASPDGINWTPQSSGTTNSLQDITYASNIFVAVGDSGTILTSPDGITWAPRSSGTTNALYGITYSNGTFVAVGLFGTILTSPNGIIWTSRSSGTTNSLKNITYASNIFVAVGVHGTILTSPDGITWTLRTSGTSVHLSGITYGSNTFIAVGDSGTILASPDGINWTHRSSGTTNRLQDITYASNIFVAVGDSGTILQSDIIYDYTITTSSTAGGSVTTPGEETYTYDYGIIVDIVATPEANHHFVNWTGTAVDAGKVADPNSSSTTVTVHGNYTLVANFAIPMLATSSTAGGSVTTPGEDTYTYDYGIIVDIVATPEANHHFVNWTGTAVDAGKVADPNSSSTTVTMHGNYTLVANFAIDTYTLEISSTVGGSVTTPGEDTYTYDYGIIVDIVATPEANHHFVNWTGTAVDAGKVADPNSSSTTVTIDSDYIAIANFAVDNYTVIFNANGGIVPSPTSKVVSYSSIYGTLAITSRVGYTFTGWFTEITGGKLVTADTAVTIIGDHTLYAQWKVNKYQFTVYSEYGNPIPRTGEYEYQTEITASIEHIVDGPAGIRYVCSSWTLMKEGEEAYTGNGNTITFNITGDTTITWNWKIQYQLIVDLDGEGSVDLTPASSGNWYDEELEVNLNAFPSIGWGFSYWSGDAEGESNLYRILMNGPKEITAHFIEKRFELIPSTLNIEIVIDEKHSEETLEIPGGISYIGGFNEVISLTASIIPVTEEITVNSTPASFVYPAGEFLLNISLSEDTRPDTYIIKLTGQSDSVTNSKEITLVVKTLVYIPSPIYGHGDSVEIPVEVSNSKSLAGFQFILEYDPAILRATGAKKGLLTEDWMISSNIAFEGEILLVGLDTNLQGLDGEMGSIVIIQADIIGEIPVEGTLVMLKDIELNDEYTAYIPFSSQDGILLGGIIGDLNGDEEINISDVILCLRMAILLPVTINGIDYTAPYTDRLIQLGDINGDGKVNISDVILILRKAIGLGE